MNHLMKKSLSLCLAFLLAWTGAFMHPSQSVHATGNIIFVDDDASGTFDGTSWTNAYKKLQNALAAAAPGDQVWVAAGIYYPDEGATQVNNNRGETFLLIHGVAIYGGFDTADTLLTDRNPSVNITILSGDIDKNDINTDGNNIAETYAAIQGSNAYNVVSATSPNTDNSAVLDGFVITAGYADGSPLQNTTVGAGIRLIDGDSPTLANLTIVGNLVISNGGGMFASENSNPALTNVAFSGNHASNGGGLATMNSDPTLNNVTFEDNYATYGGGMSALSGSSPVLTNVLFLNNSGGSSGGGGGMNVSLSTPALTNVTFNSNQAAVGGGMMVGASSHPGLTNVTFRDNVAGDYGGGVYLMGNPGVEFAYMTATNVTFSGNDANQRGGAILQSYGNITLTNVTINDNYAFVEAGGLFNTDASVSYFQNVLIANNAEGDCVDWFGSASVGANTLIEDSVNACGLTDGVDGNILGSDPLLGPLQNNGGSTQTHALLPGSPAIDMGDDAACAAAPVNNTSQNGLTRPQGSHCDIGSYEGDFTPPTVTMSSAALNPTNTSPIAVTVQFSETVTDFVASDITPGNGSVGSFVAVDGDTYTFDLTPSGQGLVTADIAAGVATDSAGNGNTIAAQFSRTYSVTYNLFLPLILR